MDAAQLSQLEGLCRTLFTSADPAERARAQQSVLVLQSSVEYIPQCEYILENSSESFALLVAANSLTKLITTHWNNFTVSQRIDIRNYVLNSLAQKGPTREKFVNTALVQLVCRITKLGWFDDDQHRNITQEVNKFLQATVDHWIIGLQIYNELVTEINTPTSGRTLTQHRKTAISFRDLALFQILQVSLTTLRQLHMRSMVVKDAQQESKMMESAIGLTIKCLSFDFIGTHPDESSEEVGALQVPSSWRVVIQEPATMDLFFETYKKSQAPNAAMAMECLTLFSSVRRSLFSSEKELSRFLSQLMSGIRDVLRNKTGLHEAENYHQFCRLLGRLKSNYQLSEMINTEGYQEWMELAADFTVKSFQQWQFSANSMHYLIGLWARMVAAVPYVKSDSSGRSISFLESYVPRVIQAYVQSRLESVEIIANDAASDDPLDDEVSLNEQIDRLPTIIRYQYSSISKYVLSFFDPLLQEYQEVWRSIGSGTDHSARNKLVVIEKKLAWLIYFIGSVIGGHTWTSRNGEGDEMIDADLCQRVFELLRVVEFRMTSSGGQFRPDVHLEYSFLAFFQKFRRSYIGEQYGMPPPSLSSESVSQSYKQKAYMKMFDRMGFGDHVVVVNSIVTKIGNNLKYWGDDSETIKRTLDVLLNLASDYSSSKLLLTLDTIKYLLSHHTAEDFPFLSLPSNYRHRTTFQTILTRLLFSSTDDAMINFERFLEPTVATLGHLNQAPSLRQDAARQAFIGACRDLRGITAATHNRRTYGTLFDALSPQYFPLFVRAAKEGFDDYAISTALLKFMMEFAYNKAQRVVFDQCSVNGILLFREISDVIVAYGTQILPLQVSSDPYKEKYKGISMCLRILTRALDGNYVNFGVFAFYKDEALDKAVDIALKLGLSVPLRELMLMFLSCCYCKTYPKLVASYFSFLEILFRNHVKSVLQLEVAVFTQLLNSLQEGLNSLESTIVSQCATAVDHLASFYFHNQSKQTPATMSLKVHMQANPSMFTTLLSTLYSLLMYGDVSCQWALSRPILSISLASEQSYQTVKGQICASQPPQNQERLERAFSALFVDVRRNLEPGNRDRFTQRITQLRQTVRGFLTG